MSLISGDGAHAADPALNRLLGKAQSLHPKSIDLTLGRLEALLAKLGNPHLDPQKMQIRVHPIRLSHF